MARKGRDGEADPSRPKWGRLDKEDAIAVLETVFDEVPGVAISRRLLEKAKVHLAREYIAQIEELAEQLAEMQATNRALVQQSEALLEAFGERGRRIAELEAQLSTRGKAPDTPERCSLVVGVQAVSVRAVSVQAVSVQAVGL